MKNSETSVTSNRPHRLAHVAKKSSGVANAPLLKHLLKGTHFQCEAGRWPYASRARDKVQREALINT